jgi:type IV fimbrial biogenesis protein FimT
MGLNPGGAAWCMGDRSAPWCRRRRHGIFDCRLSSTPPTALIGLFTLAPRSNAMGAAMERASRSAVQQGFTLIEALTVLAVTAIVTMTAVPTMASAVSRQRLANTVTDLNLAIALGRSEAMARGTRIALVPMQADDWTSGWQLFVDQNNNGLQDPGEETLQVFEAPRPGIEVRSWGAPGNARLSFNHDGFVRRAGSNALALGGIALSYNGQVRTICIAAARTRVTNTDRCS